MKRSKRIVVLLAVLVTACGAVYGISRYEEQKELIKTSDEIVLELAADTVTGLSWEYEDVSLAFHKDEKWMYDGDEAFPVDEEKVLELLELFEGFGVSFVIEDVEDYAQYGLEDPMCTIKLEAADAAYEIKLGDFSTMDSKRYVSLGDGKVYLVNEDPFDSFELTLEDMILHDELPEFEQVTEVQFTGAEEYRIVYEEDSENSYCDEDVYFVKTDEAMLPLDTNRVEAYLETIRGLTLNEYVSYNVTEEELEDFGLNSPELTVQVQYVMDEEEPSEAEAGVTDQGAAQTSLVLHISRDPEELKAAEKNPEDRAAETAGDEGKGSDNEEDITAYVRVGESQIVYQLTPTQYKSLKAAAYEDLRHQQVFAADFEVISQLDIRLEGVDYVITAEGDADDRSYQYGQETLEADDQKLSALKTAVAALEADSFTDQEPMDKEEISLVLHLDDEAHPQVTVQLYRYDSSHCLAVVDGEPVSLVARSQVVDLMEAVYAIVLGEAAGS